MADPVTAAIAWIGSEVGGEVGAYMIMNAEAIGTITAIASAVGTLRNEQLKAQQRQRDAYNASLRDRYVNSRGATNPRTLVLGRQRVGDTIPFIASYGTNKEHLTFIVLLAAHEIDAIEAIYFNDEQVTLDGSGNVTGVQRRETFSLSAASGTFTLQSAPVAGTVSASVSYGSTVVSLSVSVSGAAVTVSGATPGQTGTLLIKYQPISGPFSPPVVANTTTSFATNGSGGATVALAGNPVGPVVISGPVSGDQIVPDYTAFGSVSGSTLTVTGAPAGVACWATYQYTPAPVARIRQYLGAAGQAADATMIANLPGVWTSAHVGTGLAYLVVELDYNQDAFPSGVPNISALVRGAKVYDPRTATTAWSQNPALLMRHAATHALCGRMAATSIDDASVIVAANVCDQSTTYVVNGQSYVRPLYTAGLTYRSGTRAQDSLNDLAQAMAGKWTVDNGLLKVRAGAWTTPVITIDDSWLATLEGQSTAPVQIQPTAARQDMFNVVTAKFADEQQDLRTVDLTRVQGDAYIAADGAELPNDMQLNAITFAGQAQQVVATLMRDARQDMRVTLQCKLRSYQVTWGDNVLVTLPVFGWLAKAFEVIEPDFTLDGGIQLVLKETDPSTWSMGTSFPALDPAPNTRLPLPWGMPALAGLTIDSSSTVQVANPDGTIVQRMRVSWPAVTDPRALSGGGVEIRYGRAGTPESSWISLQALNGQSYVDIAPVQQSQSYIVTGRTFNALVNGPWYAQQQHTVGTRSVTIATAQLATGAATEVLAPLTASSVTVTNALHSPDNLSWRTVILSQSYTAPAGVACELEVTCAGQLQYTTSNNGSGTDYTGDFQDAIFTGTGTGTMVGNNEWYQPNPGAVKVYKIPLLNKRRISLAAGASVTISWAAAKWYGTDTATVTNAEMQVVVIKR